MYSRTTRTKARNLKMQHPPVILFLSNQARERDAVDKWLSESRYTTCEALDVFQALEQFSDFTTGERPDVIFLHVESAAADLRFIKTMVATAAGESDVPIIDFAGETRFGRDGKDFNEAIAKLVCRLDEFIPQHGIVRV